MCRSSRRSWSVPLLLTILAVPIAASSLFAQPPTGSPPPHGSGIAGPHDTADLYNSLRDVINYGAELFNKQADHAGCYRVYQGALISIRPFLTPETRKTIDASIVRAEALPYPAERAFELRKTLDAIRAKAAPTRTAPPMVAGAATGNVGSPVGTSGVGLPKPETPKVESPKVETPKINALKVEVPKVEVPKVDLPKITNAPKVEAPKKVETPKIELPVGGLPKPDAPKVNPPNLDIPNLDLPKVGLPKIDDKKPEAPKVDLPKVDLPKVDVPKVDAPKVDLPKIDDLKKPDAPKVDLPKIDLPKIELPSVDPLRIEPPTIPVPLIDAKDKKDPKTELGEVSGKVAIDGKPVPPGFRVTLVSSAGKRFSATLRKEGGYRFTPGVPAGKYRVTIEPSVDDAGKQTVVPARYTNDATSGLTLDVKTGPSTFDVQLVK
jgi:hypothetical protein